MNREYRGVFTSEREDSGRCTVEHGGVEFYPATYIASRHPITPETIIARIDRIEQIELPDGTKAHRAYFDYESPLPLVGRSLALEGRTKAWTGDRDGAWRVTSCLVMGAVLASHPMNPDSNLEVWDEDARVWLQVGPNTAGHIA